jgi:hypothetical protein
MKYRVDSLEKQVGYLEEYNDKVIKVLQGNTAVKLDTTKLNVPKEDISND